MSGPTLRPRSAWERLPSNWRWLVFPTCLSLQGEDLRAENCVSPKSLLDWPPQMTLTWPASFPIHFLCPRITSILYSTRICVCVCGKELTLLSNFSLPGLPQIFEGTKSRVSPSPMRTSLVLKAWHYASYSPCPEILTQCGKLLSSCCGLSPNLFM